MAFRAKRGIATLPIEGLSPLYRDEAENLTQMTQMTQKTQKNADSPSTGKVATLMRQSFLIEGFCEIREIRGHLRQVLFTVSVEGSGHLPGRLRFVDCGAARLRSE